MRRIRKLLDIGLPIAGIVVVLAAVLGLAGDLPLQVTVVVIGLLIIEAGVWKLADPLFRDERRYVGLRAAVEEFVVLVRQLNAAALERRHDPEAARRRVEQVRAAMLEAVDHMTFYAGRTNEELVAELEQQPWPVG